MRGRGGAGLTMAGLILLIGVALAFAIGRFPISPLDLGRVLLAKLTGHPSGLPHAVETVVWQIRGPRVVAAVLVGSALATAGAAFQGLFRNPAAEKPSIWVSASITVR